MAAIEELGGQLIVMASRALARVADGPADYERVYDRILSQARAAGDPALAGRHVRPGARRLLGHAPTSTRRWTTRARHHRAQRRQGRRHQDLAARRGQGDRDAPPPAGGRAHVHRRRLQLRRADRRRRRQRLTHSDALLGIFDAIAPAASAALARARRAATSSRFHAILAPTVPLSRHIFAAPTRFYKTGVVFLAWLNGHQDAFTMVGGQQSARSLAAPRRAVPAGRRGRPARAARARGARA